MRLLPVLTGSFIDNLLSNNQDIIYYVLIFILYVIFNFVANFTMTILTSKVANKINLDIINHLQNAKREYINNLDSAEVTQNEC